MKPYAMVLPSTAFFGSSVGNFFVKSFNTGEAYLLLLLVFAFVMTYGLGYMLMCKISPHYKETMNPPLEKAEVVSNSAHVADVAHNNRRTKLEDHLKEDSDEGVESNQDGSSGKSQYEVEKNKEEKAVFTKDTESDDDHSCSVGDNNIQLQPLVTKNQIELKKDK